MRRLAFGLAAFAVVVPPAHAEAVWMVKSSGVVACKDRETLAALAAEAGAQASGAKLPEGCVELYTGERLLEQYEMGIGFDAYMRVQRSDSRIVYVPRSNLVSDVGIGSVTDDRR